MILRDVRRTLKSLEVATTGQLAAELSAKRSEVESALQFWIRRGDVTLCAEEAGPVCGSTCRRCPLGNARGGANLGVVRSTGRQTVYEWVGT
ncbi:MAG: FeoC-like transcriptional regulator [Spirochaetaceae bacterium]